MTPKPQPGNPQPRLFRLPEEQAIINRMGFNNAGVEALLGNHLQFKTTLASEGNLIYQCPVGINVGKNLSTSVEDAHRDYARCIRLVYPHADYITANVSLSQHSRFEKSSVWGCYEVPPQRNKRNPASNV